MNRCLCGFVALSVASVTLAQGIYPPVEFHELLLDPPGPNAGAQVIEVRTTSLQADLTGWQLVTTGGIATPLPAVVLPPFAIAQIHLGATGISTQSDVFLPQAPLLGSSGAIALARHAPVTAADLVDFACWNGGSADPLAAIAVQVGRWPNLLANLTMPAEGRSIANYGDNRPVWIGPGAWYADGTPTLGLPNDPGLTRNRGIGCLGNDTPVIVTPSNVDTGPWLGEQHTFVFGYLPDGVGFFFVVFGLQDTGPVSLAPFGMPQCASWLSWDAVVAVAWSQQMAQFAYAVPANAQLTGLLYYAQALVPVATAWHAGPQVSNALVLRVGSR